MNIKDVKVTGISDVLLYSGVVTEMFERFQDVIKISFFAEGINRVQSTLLCELKGSYVQQSQRYVEMNNDNIYFPGFESLSKDEQTILNNIVEKSFDLYKRMTELNGGVSGRPKLTDFKHGIPFEDGRYALPLAVTTNVSATLTLRQLAKMKTLVTPGVPRSILHEIYSSIYEQLPRGIVNFLINAPQGTKSLFNNSDFDFYLDVLHLPSLCDKDAIYLEELSNCSIEPVAIGALTSTTKNPFTKERTIEELTEITNRVLGYGHTSILEQATTTFLLTMSLASYHQFLRHRIPNNVRQSFNDVCVKSNGFVLPETIGNSIFKDEYLNLLNEFSALRATLINGRQNIALSLLTNADKIKVISETNARADVEIAKERTCLNAQWEIRQLYQQKMDVLLGIAPTLYKNGVPSCVYGACKEGKLSCKKAVEVRNYYLSKTENQ